MTDTETLGRALVDAASNRAAFDSLLTRYAVTCTAAQLKAIFRAVTGHDVAVARSKADIIKRMHTWQREKELNDDLHAAQAKHRI